MPLVEEIFVMNNNPEVVLEAFGKKTVVINSTNDLGLFSRFGMAALASLPTVLLVDDDIFLPEATLTQLHAAWLTDPDILHGIIRRNTVPEGYSGELVLGPCEIVLTRAVLNHASVCAQALSYARRFNAEVKGEDILLSYLVARASRRFNMAYPLPIEEFTAPEAVHVRISNHMEHRSKVVKWCREHIAGIAVNPATGNTDPAGQLY